METKTCTNCGTRKSIDEFYDRRGCSSITKMSHCKTCCKERATEWAKQNEDRYRDYHREYMQGTKKNERVR